MNARGIVKTFDAGTYTASVQLVGSRSAYLTGVPVSRGIPAGEMLAGRDCVIAVFESTDPTDLMLVGVR